MRNFVGWVGFFPKPWDHSSWLNYKIWVCFIASSSEIFGKPHFQQQRGLVQQRGFESSVKFWTEGFLANGKANQIGRCITQCWSKCSWSRVNPTLRRTESPNIKTCQAKYIVRNVSWWTWTALASAWWSLPLLWPDVWLPSALEENGAGKNTEVWGGRGQNLIASLSACIECFRIVCCEQNREKLITLTTALKQAQKRTGTSPAFFP